MPTSRFPTPRRLGLAALAAAVASCLLALAPAGASAATCDPWDDDDLAGVAPFEYVDDGYDTTSGAHTGAVEDAQDTGKSGRSDAYDLYGELYLSDDGATFTRQPAAAADSCGREDGDREITYPEQSVAGLEVHRKTYIPNTGDITFARFLSVLRNPGDSPVTVDLRECGDFGSDSATEVVETSSGDDTIDESDRWATTWDTNVDSGGEENGDPQAGTNWDADVDAGLDRADSVTLANRPDDDDPHNGGADDLCVTYEDVTVPAGGTVAYMFIGVLGLTRAEVNEESAAIAAQPDEIFAGLSADECAQLRNWSCPSEAPAPPPPAPPAPPAAGPVAQQLPAPRVTIAGRRACASRTARVTVRASLAPGLTVRAVRVTLDGRRIKAPRRSRFTLRINVQRLRPGRHRLRIAVTDSAGRRRTVKRTLVRCAQSEPRRRAAPRFTG